MFKCLEKLGITAKEFKELTEMNPDLESMDEKDIENSILFLRDLECPDGTIRNIILSDAFYLSRMITDLEKTVHKLKEIGFMKFEIIDLIDSYPFILEIDDFEIDKFVEKKLSEGMPLIDICESIIYDPYEI